MTFGLTITNESYAEGTNIYYNADQLPNSSLWEDIFSTYILGSANWTSSNGELTMTTFPGNVGIWFGNASYIFPPNWTMGSSCEGNFISVRAKLDQNSGEWNIHLYDGQHGGFLMLYDGYITYRDPNSVSIEYPIDTTSYHVYSILLKDGKVRYEIDGQIIYAGIALEQISSGTLILIGDGSGSSLLGYGKMIVDYAHFITEPDMDPIMLGDFTLDCSVDIDDVYELSTYWLTDPNNRLLDFAPCGGDQFIDLSDFAILAKYWLLSTTPCPW